MNSPLDIPELKPHEFARICELAHSRFGLNLREGKERLVSARLAKLMRKGGFRSFDDYYHHVIDDRTGDALTAMIDSLTTNHTSFFREAEHFRFLAELLPRLLQRQKLSIWSAACATGEEPYSILFTALEAQRKAALANIEVRATDISTRVLYTAREAVYPAERVANVPPDMLTRYFGRVKGGCYRVLPQYVEKVRFERLNLMEPFSAGNTWPVIFCRNVMIYFDRQTRADLVRRLTACLEPGGYLFVGHAESLIGAENGLRYVRPAVYRREPPGGGRRA